MTFINKDHVFKRSVTPLKRLNGNILSSSLGQTGGIVATCGLFEPCHRNNWHRQGNVLSHQHEIFWPRQPTLEVSVAHGGCGAREGDVSVNNTSQVCNYSFTC